MTSQGDCYPFMPDQRGLREPVRAMSAVSAVIAFLMAAFAVFLFIQRLARGGDGMALAVAAAAGLIALFAWRAFRAYAATLCASADLILDDDGLRVAITDARKLLIAPAVLKSARLVEVTPRSSFHPDRDGDRAIVVIFPDRRVLFRLAASYYRQHGSGAVIITPDHERGRELADRLREWSD